MPTERPLALPSAGLQWQTGHTPFATRFGDVYYSREGGLAEVRHVFLDGCGLPEAWRTADTFTIGELGFGTGLNFLACWDLWRRTCKPGARLHYVSVEGYPLTPGEIGDCTRQWPELSALGAGLLRVYPSPQPGFHRLFPRAAGDSDARVFLTLLCGEAGAVLPQLEARIDAWFLDGFAPERNPEMWRREVLAEVARLSHAGTCLATYSAAGDVRRGLGEAGFDVAKAPGFGSKREMLRASFRNSPAKSALQPWFARSPVAPRHQGHAAIVGGGIAGTAVANALRRRGWRTTIIEKRGSLAEESSGNPTAVLMPRLTAAPNLDGRFYASAWRFALAALDEIADGGRSLCRDQRGLLHLATDAAETERQSLIIGQGSLPEDLMAQIGSSEASDIAGCHVPVGALYFPQGGWLQPRDFCEALADGANVILQTDVVSLEHRDGLWEVRGPGDNICVRSDVVVLANALGAMTFPSTAWLPLKARRGQISLVPPTLVSANLRATLAYGGTITPLHRGVHTIGATFDWIEREAWTQEPLVSEPDHRRNLDVLRTALPDLAAGIDLRSVSGRAGLRCTTLDHLPLAGPVPDREGYLRDFAELRAGHRWARYVDAPYQSGLFVLTGLGSRGMVAAPLAAEIVASEITGEPWPVERELVTALHPGRFLVRDLKRREA